MFFAILFPLMFLVLFGGLFADQDQSKVDLIEVGDVSLVEPLPGGAKRGLRRDLRGQPTPTISTHALEEVRKGDADVAIEQAGRDH